MDGYAHGHRDPAAHGCGAEDEVNDVRIYQQ